MNDIGIQHIPKIFFVCDRTDTASLWGCILQQQGWIVIVECSVERAIDHWSTELPDLLLIDIDITKQDPIELCKTFRTISVAPILLFLPVYNELQILEAYTSGVDDVLVKPVSHTIFIPKLMAWVRRTWIIPT